MTETEDEYMTISVFKCRECNGTGKIRNPDFERCNITKVWLKDGCSKCPAKPLCDLGEMIDCEVCDGGGQLLVSHRSFQPIYVQVMKMRNE